MKSLTIDRTQIPEEMKHQAAAQIGDGVELPDDRLWKTTKYEGGHKMVMITQQAIDLAEGKNSYEPVDMQHQSLFEAVKNTRGNVVKVVVPPGYWHPKTVRLNGGIEIGLHDYLELMGDLEMQTTGKK